ncbi:hypothetical protein ASPZODRAFT_20476 [Penicilliopsis zonata CBS 506.65]|uniref:Uncharacterized protein n=1 Tax=Penicilliopsis zonata CBS 506.65 TaxID=1073090 RepID=A0A1L9S5R4_9EURO|nr:hypothetical protein ASPZODRAFT_20476 [Penicilliopsis zonata CBS 506.65]OJJ42511.1 hypothetical protein ASPZODRAFT_20476 [Penicilliopsis zonata CBS 506.65]
MDSLNSVEKAWSMYTLSGFVTVDPSAFRTVPNDNVIPGMKNVYMPSAFHQLHCLKALQVLYTTATNSEIYDHDHKHTAHCFDYLRQGVLCGGDMTLESKGGTATHTCRSWTQIEQWQQKHLVGS